MADTTAWIFYITTPTGDQMNMAMKYRLACHLTSIHADIKSLDFGIFCKDGGPNLKQQIMARLQLGYRQTEVVRHMTLWND